MVSSRSHAFCFVEFKQALLILLFLLKFIEVRKDARSVTHAATKLNTTDDIDFTLKSYFPDLFNVVSLLFHDIHLTHLLGMILLCRSNL